MKPALITVWVACVLSAAVLIGCDSIPGLGSSPTPQQPVVPGAQPAGQPTAPTMPAAPVPTVPGMVPQLPGPGTAPAVPPVPGAMGVPPTAPSPVGVQPTVPVVPGAPGAALAAPAVPGSVAAPPSAPTAPVPTGDPLFDKINELQMKLVADRVATGGPSPTKLSLAAGKHQAYDIMLPGPPYCHSYIAAGGTGVENLDLSISSPLGSVEGSDGTVEPSAVIANHCPTAPGNYRLTVTMTKGSGDVAVQVFSK